MERKVGVVGKVLLLFGRRRILIDFKFGCGVRSTG